MLVSNDSDGYTRQVSVAAPRERRCDDAKLAFFILYK